MSLVIALFLEGLFEKVEHGSRQSPVGLGFAAKGVEVGHCSGCVCVIEQIYSSLYITSSGVVSINTSRAVRKTVGRGSDV